MICDIECIKKYSFWTFQFSIFNVGMSLLISIYMIVKHLHNFNRPQFQSKIIVILVMAPFYGMASLLSLQYPHYAQYVELVRDIYLAFLLFTFFYLMFSYMAYDPETKTMSDDRCYSTMMKYESSISHLWPLTYCTQQYYLTTKAKAKYFTYRCKKFVLQYFVLKPVLTLVLVFLHPFLKSEKIVIFISERKESLASFLHFLVMLSESFSLYYLVMFYTALKKPLAPYRPLLKFVIIKITLFFTFWQTITLGIVGPDIVETFFETSKYYSEEVIVSGIENTLVCFEMLLMALASILAFSHKEFLTEQESQTGNLKDALLDNWDNFKHDLRLIKPKKFGFTSVVVEERHWSPMRSRKSANSEFDIELFDYPRLSQAVKVAYM